LIRVRGPKLERKRKGEKENPGEIISEKWQITVLKDGERRGIQFFHKRKREKTV